MVEMESIDKEVGKEKNPRFFINTIIHKIHPIYVMNNFNLWQPPLCIIFQLEFYGKTIKYIILCGTIKTQNILSDMYKPTLCQ